MLTLRKTMYLAIAGAAALVLTAPLDFALAKTVHIKCPVTAQLVCSLHKHCKCVDLTTGVRVNPVINATPVPAGGNDGGNHCGSNGGNCGVGNGNGGGNGTGNEGGGKGPGDNGHGPGGTGNPGKS